MSTFVINPHGRMHEWIAEEKGYFAKAGLTDYALQAHSLLTKDAPQATTSLSQATGTSRTTETTETTKTTETRQGAYQTYESGRDASISCACHWTVNMAASASHGRLWGECYSVSPCAVFVPEGSTIRKPEDLANVSIHVGFQSGSHYATIQALEPFMDSQKIQLKFTGNPHERVDQLIDGSAPAATLFGAQLYIAEQLGFRKIVDCTFMMAAMVPDGVDLRDVARYYEALRMAQADIDQLHQPYLHYYLEEMPARHAKLIDVRRFGPGERIVFEPYSQQMYDSTHQWVEDRDIFDADKVGTGGYEQAVARIS